MKILFASPEAHPLIKTGGLADVAGALPRALKNLHHEVRLVLPAYRSLLDTLETPPAEVARLQLHGDTAPVRILQTHLPGSALKVWLVDAPGCFDRPGNPYVGPDGHDWPDNAQRFARFARAVVELAQDRAGLGWRAELVHTNDWQCGLVPALLSLEAARPATLFTIHNLAYQGLFDAALLGELGLPPHWWSMEALEFHGRLSFIKGGLVFADRLTTVSPTYAREICTPQFGYGLEGLLRHRQDRLSGILNGADYQHWNPGKDPHLAANYNGRSLAGKAVDKAALQREFGLPERPQTPLLAHIGRLVEQKGVDLILGALPRLMEEDVQLVVLGSGEAQLEAALREAQAAHPQRIGVRIGYDEPLAHRIEAGADLFLMPSRFEPCGLNQIYSLRYGTVPVVRRTGGLADTVVDASEAALRKGTATGFQFDAPTTEALLQAIGRALGLYRQPPVWRRLIGAGMRQDFSWTRSARRYLEVYRLALADRG
ncbi:glycogen synthase GlgA [Thiohalobacter sp. IOR34]|uniref:glycogen synthase GlgA n=1 Tax=Thiohalobacter sp. IOR34 TaxID=3057176 RepID=UPI0025B1DAF7|nr:glycogen synthase GlgA [Thiohalobacter sp. IOR34]WJW74897.1 glycogen synthase GlgA [Thiohalobacter sp. IOR34]